MQCGLDNITGRVIRFGTEEPIIQIFGKDRIIVQLPGASGSVTDIVLAPPDPDAPFPVLDDDVATVLSRVLTEAGYEDFEVEVKDNSTFKVRSNTVNAETQGRALVAITNEIGSIASFSVTSGIEEAKALVRRPALL